MLRDLACVAFMEEHRTPPVVMQKSKENKTGKKEAIYTLTEQPSMKMGRQSWCGSAPHVGESSRSQFPPSGLG